ncbi:MAG: DNA repair protein RadC [Alphaproteobacteria bacterium]|nr:DNA repair protein RadC [Alphaproteobacteria bacterium]MBU1559463.1 DNA repair protein RadC [Alphaproteobacteria bacterium]MBU2301515.1 DNA repair protein RadC [Alphaproteobacteria bacterium]MBU2369756.1 DNA repair protein RadC [Alphaproteobacteria bacterium]
MRSEADDHAGHRQRVRERFLKVGGDALEDYELLELALQLAIPRRDTKALAKTLLREFGSFSGVFNASQARLEKVDGLGASSVAHIKVIQAVAARFGRDRIDSDKPILSSWSQLIDYCRSQMAYESIEQFRILFLDKKNRLIADEVQQTGTVDHTPVYPREVIKRALEHSATALILVHNHPSGDPSPSSADVRMTREISDIAKPLGITLHDHIIIGKSGHASLRGLKLL